MAVQMLDLWVVAPRCDPFSDEALKVRSSLSRPRNPGIARQTRLPTLALPALCIARRWVSRVSLFRRPRRYLAGRA